MGYKDAIQLQIAAMMCHLNVALLVVGAMCQMQIQLRQRELATIVAVLHAWMTKIGVGLAAHRSMGSRNFIPTIAPIQMVLVRTSVPSNLVRPSPPPPPLVWMHATRVALTAVALCRRIRLMLILAPIVVPHLVGLV